MMGHSEPPGETVPAEYQFDAVLERAGSADASYVRIPLDVPAVFGTPGQVKVQATIAGVPYRGSLANMGMGCHILPVTQAVRKAAGKALDVPALPSGTK